MDCGQLLIIPPLFDGTNYAYWKVRMRAFLQSLDEKVWVAVKVEWTKPTDPSASSRALNALFSAMTNKE